MTAVLKRITRFLLKLIIYKVLFFSRRNFSFQSCHGCSPTAALRVFGATSPPGFFYNRIGIKYHIIQSSRLRRNAKFC